MMLQSLSQMEVAMKSFEELCSSFPNCCDAFVSYGQVLLENQQFEPAKKMFEKAIKLDPDNATVLVHRGMLFQQWKGDSKAFEQDLKEALRLDEKCEAAYETLGTLEIQRGDLNLGIEYFRKALPLVKSEAELAHLFSLIEASATQLFIAESLGTPLPNGFAPSGFEATVA